MTSHFLRAALVLALVSAPSLAAPDRAIDAFLDRAPPPEQEIRGARVEHQEARLGVPTFVWGDREAIPGLSGKRASPEQAARGHLNARANVFKLSPREVAEAQVAAVHDRGHGAIVVTFKQALHGVEVFRNELKVVMDQERRLVAMSGYLAPSDLADRVRAIPPGRERVTAREAIAKAFSDLSGQGISADLVANERAAQGGYSEMDLTQGVMAWRFSTPARAKPVYFTLSDQLVRGYYVEVDAGRVDDVESTYLAYVIAADDGRILFRHDLTAAESFTYKVWANPVTFTPYDGPQGDDPTPHPTGNPDGYQAPFIAPELVSLQNVPFSRNDPWLPPGSVETIGNNADAYADLGAPDGFQPGIDLRPNVTAPGVFDYTYDVTMSPAANEQQRKAAVVDLFYMNNWLHDWYYDSGFDELSGNAQAFNYGRGGLENDALRVEGQDYGGRNNANMSTPADGARPRMQMYIFDGRPTLAVSSPASVAGNYDTGSASFGASAYDVTGPVKILNPAGVTEGCTAFPAGTFTGTIALLDRGTCAFALKAANAQAAGAIGVLIANNVDGTAIGLGGTDPAVTVPTQSMTKAAGAAWKAELVADANTVISARMRRDPNLDRDGTLDNGIIAHEWGHYISNRLVANSAGLTNNQGRSMGEGWADFTAMLMQVREEDRARPGNDQYQGVYTVAGYTSAGGANQGYYFGIRRIPYSTDFAKNALTLRHIANGNALPAVPMAFGGVTSNSQYHNSGEIWATMLWESYVSLLNAYPFQEAQDRMKRYLVAAFKATPPAPTYLEARDALWAVALANDPADYQRFVAAFARRGAGHGAKVADRNSQDHLPVVESYASGANLEVLSVRLDDSLVGCDADGLLDVGETGLLTVSVKNTGGSTLAAFNGAVTASGATATIGFPGGNTLAFPSLAPGAVATASISVNLTATSAPAATAGLSIAFDEPSLPATAQTTGYDGRVHADELMNASNVETAETSLFAWTSTTRSGNNLWQPAGAIGGRYLHAWNQSVTSDVSLTSPWLHVSPTANFTITLVHRYSFESTNGAAPFYDGGVVEFSLDGLTWYDVLVYLGRHPGYVAPPLEATTNPLSGRYALAALSSGYPNWRTSTMSIGTALAGQKVKFRFRIGTDEAVGAYGWDIDSVTFAGITNTPFPAFADETATTCNRRPIADAGRIATVNERTLVTLDGSASFDPDGQALTYQWTQLSGPAVTLSDATAVRPTFTPDGVAANQQLTFQLVVNDGVDASYPKTVDIYVNNVNRVPVSVATAPATVAERSTATVTLDGTGSSDEDGETLTYQWTQTAGPEVELTGATSATATFPLPEVAADTTFTFALTVTDPIGAGHTSSADITVTNVDRAPTADAGADVTVAGRTAVTLAGSGSDPDGEALTYAWTQVGTPAVVLTGADTATPSFTSPDVKAQTDLTFQLVVTANGVASAADAVVVTVEADGAPVANAGADLTVEERTTVSITGTGTDPEDDAITAYAWTQTAGPTVTIDDPAAATLAFVAPNVLADTVLTFELVVTANGVNSAADAVNVTIQEVNRRPIGRGPPADTKPERTAVTLSAATSSDPDGDPLTFAWTQTGGPAVTVTGANTDTLAFTTPEVLVNTKVTFALVVTDNHGAESEPVAVELTVTDVNRAPTASARKLTGGIVKQEVVLDAAASADPDGDAIATYAWTQTAGTNVTLTGANSATAKFTAPEQPETLSFQLTVTDAKGATANSTVDVVIEAAEGCGCSSSSNASNALFWVGILGVVALRRRRAKA